MNKILLIAAVIFSALSFASCSDDAPSQLIWEFSNYDNKKITAVYAPDYVNQVQIVAAPDYQGEISLKCTNYRQLSIIPDFATGTSDNAEVGYSVSKIDDTTIKVTFKPIEKTTNEGIYGYVLVEGKSGKDSNSTNISIGRINK